MQSTKRRMTDEQKELFASIKSRVRSEPELFRPAGRWLDEHFSATRIEDDYAKARSDVIAENESRKKHNARLRLERKNKRRELRERLAKEQAANKKRLVGGRIRRLSKKQKAFVREYMKDFNATKAAIRATYSKKTAASRGATLLTNPNLQRAIEASIEGRIQLLTLRHSSDYPGFMSKLLSPVRLGFDPHHAIYGRHERFKAAWRKVFDHLPQLAEEDPTEAKALARRVLLLMWLVTDRESDKAPFEPITEFQSWEWGNLQTFTEVGCGRRCARVETLEDHFTDRYIAAAREALGELDDSETGPGESNPAAPSDDPPPPKPTVEDRVTAALRRDLSRNWKSTDLAVEVGCVAEQVRRTKAWKSRPKGRAADNP